MSVLTVEDLERDEELRRRVARLLAVEIASEPELRTLILNAVLREVATKRDLENLRREIYEQLRDLERRISERISDLDKRIDALDKRIDALDKRLDFMAKVALGLFGTVLALLLAQIIVGLLH